MKLALTLGYSGAQMSLDMEKVLEVERLGFDSVWSAESYGSDAVTPAAWIAARTSRIHVGTGIMQLAGRSPAATAMTALTLDGLSGGRFRLGLGVSGPQVVRGWIPTFFSPRYMKSFREWLDEGFRARGGAPARFDIMPMVSVVVGDDVAACRQPVRARLALYVGGMGARGRNFYNDIARRYGYEAAARTIQDLYLAGRKEEAEAAVPDALVDEVALCGPRERIRERLGEWSSSGITTRLGAGDRLPATTMAELVL